MSKQMNNQRITQWIEALFTPYTQTPAVEEQKEELTHHLTEKVREYMANGNDYDTAFHRAIEDMGEPKELLANFSDILEPIIPDPRELLTLQNSLPTPTPMWEAARQHYEEALATGKKKPKWPEKLILLSPFVYILLGVFFGWWAWAWVIIPIAFITLDRIK